uniref:Uncharacterized protein n=1 Tax=Anguilla anguilla TaxID=7936 RepID=A0A0E9TTR4_ANGAN
MLWHCKVPTLCCSTNGKKYHCLTGRLLERNLMQTIIAAG